MITLDRLLEVYETKTKIAEVLNISTQAISQWDDVPVYQQLRLKYEIDPTEFKGDNIDAELL